MIIFRNYFSPNKKEPAKRRYYTKEGNYLGDFVEESIVKRVPVSGLNQINLIKRQADR